VWRDRARARETVKSRRLQLCTHPTYGTCIFRFPYMCVCVCLCVCETYSRRGPLGGDRNQFCICLLVLVKRHERERETHTNTHMCARAHTHTHTHTHSTHTYTSTGPCEEVREIYSREQQWEKDPSQRERERPRYRH